jgi:hypothetical protein
MSALNWSPKKSLPTLPINAVLCPNL